MKTDTLSPLGNIIQKLLPETWEEKAISFDMKLPLASYSDDPLNVPYADITISHKDFDYLKDVKQQVQVEANPEPETYTIQINEEQRKLLIQTCCGNIGCTAEETEEVTALRTMLHKIYQDEKEHPGILHGLCL